MSDSNFISLSRPTQPTVGSATPVGTNDSKFPTEVINLPSKGWFYPPENPLSSGTIELKMMTAKEEDILTSKNLIKKNIVLDKLLESVIINKNINQDDILVCDRNAIFFALRRLAYGDDYTTTITCGRCEKENSVTIDLNKFDNKPFDFDKYPRGINAFDFTLPSSKITVTYKLLAKRDENVITRELETFEKLYKEVSKEITTRLSHVITSVNGDVDKMKVRKFVNEEFLSKDSLAFRRHIKDTMPDIDTTFDFCCSSCGLERKEETPVGVTFFWPNG